MTIITAEQKQKFSDYSNMRGVEDHIRLAIKHLRKRKSKAAQERAAGLEFALFSLEVMFPDCFPGPCPIAFYANLE